jgi:hypothetical protein
MPAQTFPMAIEPRWRFVLWLWGVTARRAFVRLDDNQFNARYGFFSLTTMVDNVEGWTITGPYRWWRAIGLRSNWPFREWAFDTNARAGVDLRFRRSVRFARIVRASVLTVTVADPDALAAALAARGVPGEDLRRPRR